MAGSLLERLRALIAEGDAPDVSDTPSETPEPVGQGEDPSVEPDANEIDPTTGELAAGNVAPDAAPESPASDPAAEGADSTPEPVETTDAQRDVANDVAAQNEELRLRIEALDEENRGLRLRIAELGGDASLGIVESDPVDPAEVPGSEPEEYDADADMAAQEAEIEALRNT